MYYLLEITLSRPPKMVACLDVLILWENFLHLHLHPTKSEEKNSITNIIFQDKKE